jgi:hypothetical protein
VPVDRLAPTPTNRPASAAFWQTGGNVNEARLDDLVRLLEYPPTRTPDDPAGHLSESNRPTRWPTEELPPGANGNVNSGLCIGVSEKAVSRFETARQTMPRLCVSDTELWIDSNRCQESDCSRCGGVGNGFVEGDRRANHAGNVLSRILRNHYRTGRTGRRRQFAALYVCSQGQCPRTHVHGRHADCADGTVRADCTAGRCRASHRIAIVRSGDRALARPQIVGGFMRLRGNKFLCRNRAINGAADTVCQLWRRPPLSREDQRQVPF